ncbi:hypothetical protein VTL71DRAFT_9718 [Oculimacula yallundae]|uniref:Protein kinase domain-containing protein n=1 Tax=Oculimacula yallundae TaxID=86028 RepID=A0ABR4BUH1_9HELO
MNTNKPVDLPIFGQQLGVNWQATKLLGTGNNGIVTLWSYRGAPLNAPPVTQVAIKQYLAPIRPDFDAFAEYKYLDLLGKSQSKHILRQYRPAASYKLPNQIQNQDVLQIGLFLQYCPGGELTELMDFEKFKKGRESKRLILEEDCWDLFYCLSLAVSVMDRGTEDPKSPPVLHGLWDVGLVHYEKTPKVQACSPPKRRLQQHLPNRLIMHAILNRYIHLPARQPKALWQPPYSDMRYANKYAHGTDLFGGECSEVYSKTLRELVMHCLMHEPNHRVGVQELQARVSKGRREVREVGRRLDLLDELEGREKFRDVNFVGGEWYPEPLAERTSNAAWLVVTSLLTANKRGRSGLSTGNCVDTLVWIKRAARKVNVRIPAR